ncbi:DUF2683 family protein [Candidatus Micrarchaeota archaeon]|nr:DUF2683 family protein [Candidatus Micrarchaeota archaeon]
MSGTVAVNLKISKYTSRVLGVVKETYGLKDKAQALDKFTEIFGSEFIEPEVSEDYVKKLLRIEEQHFEKYGYRKMTDKELNQLFGK